ncbi:MAG: MBL fold metallo-hydrolase [Solirubrobacterales bacterium]
MLFRQILQEDLGCASYFVAGDGSAAVVDPRWDIEVYLQLARLHDVRIDHVLETHTHADHVSGHGRLARSTGATIHIHELAEAGYPHEPFADGWTLELGDVAIEAVHTPGHRPEHTAFVVCDRSRAAEPWALLSGDSLFVGDVARPDLAVDKREGAAAIYQSLHERLFDLADEVEVWPGHLGGSLCGSAGIDEKTSSTVGYERRHNRIMRFDSEQAFVDDAVEGLSEQPPNFQRIVELNRGELLHDLGAPRPLAPRAVEEAQAEGTFVIDARTHDQFDEAHIPGAISASAYDTGFATKVAWAVPPGSELIVVASSDGYEAEAVELLAAVGMRIRGYLAGGMTAWRSEDRPVERIPKLTPDDLAGMRDEGEDPMVLDVRARDEYATQHLPDSRNIPYQELTERLDEVPRDRRVATICAGGKRSALAASVLQRNGFDVLHVAGGGVSDWAEQGHPVEAGS